MPAFRYEAIDPDGLSKKGVVNADSARAARADLRSQNFLPITVELITNQLDAEGKKRRSIFGEHLSTVELALFTRQLASLLEAGYVCWILTGGNQDSHRAQIRYSNVPLHKQ